MGLIKLPAVVSKIGGISHKSGREQVGMIKPVGLSELSVEVSSIDYTFCGSRKDRSSFFCGIGQTFVGSHGIDQTFYGSMWG